MENDEMKEPPLPLTANLQLLSQFINRRKCASEVLRHLVRRPAGRRAKRLVAVPCRIFDIRLVCGRWRVNFSVDNVRL